MLLVDIDPQCNATTSLGINPHQLPLSLYDVLVDGKPIQEALTLTDWLNLDLARPPAPIWRRRMWSWRACLRTERLLRPRPGPPGGEIRLYPD